MNEKVLIDLYNKTDETYNLSITSEEMRSTLQSMKSSTAEPDNIHIDLIKSMNKFCSSFTTQSGKLISYQVVGKPPTTAYAW